MLAFETKVNLGSSLLEGVVDYVATQAGTLSSTDHVSTFDIAAVAGKVPFLLEAKCGHVFAATSLSAAALVIRRKGTSIALASFDLLSSAGKTVAPNVADIYPLDGYTLEGVITLTGAVVTDLTAGDFLLRVHNQHIN